MFPQSLYLCVRCSCCVYALEYACSRLLEFTRVKQLFSKQAPPQFYLISLLNQCLDTLRTFVMIITFISKKYKITTVTAYLSEVAYGLQDQCLVHWSDQFLRDFSEQFMKRRQGNRNKSGSCIKEKAIFIKTQYIEYFFSMSFCNIEGFPWGFGLLHASAFLVNK